MAWKKFENSLRQINTHNISLGDIGGAMFGDFGGITGADDAAAAAREGARLSADATVAATEKNIEFQKWLFGEQKALQQPYADMGEGTIPQYQDMLSQPIDPKEDPGYQFGLNQGTQALESSGAARGMQLSGASLKDITRFGNDYASTKYNESFNRRQVNLDNLYRMITTGQAAASGQAQAGSQMGAQVGSSIAQAGQAQSQMYSDIGNINAAQAGSNWNTLMDVGQLAVSAYGAK